MNIYEKLQSCRVELQNKKLKKSGENKFVGFKYYELADFLPTVNELFLKYKLSSNFSIYDEMAWLMICDIEKPEERITFSSPIAEANIKGCTPVQSLGGVHTYLKRYLYINALEIVENDILDASVGTNKLETKVPKRPSSNNKDKTDKEKLISEIDTLEIQTNTDHEEMLKFYKVESNIDMTMEQLEDARHRLEMKKKKQNIENLVGA